MNIDMKHKKSFVILTILFLILSACGGSDDTSSENTDATEETTTTTVADVETSSGDVYNEADLVVPPILLKPLIGATGILTDASSDWEVISEIVPLDMGVKIRTADNGTAQMTFEDGSSLLMGGNSVINIRSFDYDEEAKARVLTVDVISGSIAYDIKSEGLQASLAKIVTPTAELSVHGTEGVFEYDVTTLSAKSTVLEGGEEADDAVFSELLPDENGQPVLVAISQTAGTELGSATTGGSGWTEEEPGTVALIVDDFVSNMEGDCSYTCKAETQEGLADGSETLTPDTAPNAVFTENDTERLDLTSTLLTAAGAPEEITQSVENLAEVVAEVAVPEEEVKEFIDEAWNTAPGDDGQWQELPPLTLADNFGDAAKVHENEELKDLGFNHEEHGGFRAQHGMMQFISADTNAVNELAETGDVASAMALAAANMFVNAETEGFAEGTYCFDNPEDQDCLGGGPDPDFLAQAFAGNHFVEDMVNDMGFAYTFTENDLKPNYCEESPWLPECASGPGYVGDEFKEGGSFCEANPESCQNNENIGNVFFNNDDNSTFCEENADDPMCTGGNSVAVYTFFHVYDDEVLGEEWKPVDCTSYPDDPMCTGEGDFFHEHVGEATAIALDRNDMFDIYGGPQQLEGPPPEFCQENENAPECSEDFRPSDIFEDGEYIQPSYCDEKPDAPECDPNFGQGGGLQGPLTGNLLATYAAPTVEELGQLPNFCSDDPNHPECSRDYFGPKPLETGEFLGNLFSDDSYIDLEKQGVFYDSINGADDLASQRYGNHDDYLVIDCTVPENQNDPACSVGFSPENSNLFSGGQDGIAEYESFNPEDTGDLCENNPQDPLCFVQPVGGQGPSQTDIFGPVDGEPIPPGVAPANIGFWGDEQKAGEFKEQTDTFTDFAGNYCDENPDDPTCSSVPPPPPQDGIIQDQDCADNPYAPGCPQSGGQEGQGPPPEGDGYNPPPTEGDAPPPSGPGQDQEDCADNPYAPGCQPPTEGDAPPPPEGDGYNPPPTEGDTPPAGDPGPAPVEGDTPPAEDPGPPPAEDPGPPPAEDPGPPPEPPLP